MRRRLVAKTAAAEVPVDVDDSPAEALPFANASFDTVVFTVVLCTVTDPDRAWRRHAACCAPAGG
jgi:ubiquinone/menaquinone biosynthesis C-methylase UbiE